MTELVEEEHGDEEPDAHERAALLKQHEDEDQRKHEEHERRGVGRGRAGEQREDAIVELVAFRGRFGPSVVLSFRSFRRRGESHRRRGFPPTKGAVRRGTDDGRVEQRTANASGRRERDRGDERQRRCPDGRARDQQLAVRDLAVGDHAPWSREGDRGESGAAIARSSSPRHVCSGVGSFAPFAP